MRVRRPPRGTAPEELTRQLTEFIDAYLANPKDENASAAAVKAGYPAHKGTGLLKKPCVANEIARRRRLAAKRAEITEDFVLAGVLAIANFDPRRLYDETGKLKPISQLDDETARAIGELEVEEIRDRENVGRIGCVIVKRRVNSMARLKALELLGKYRGTWDGSKSTDRKNGLEQLRDAILSSPK